MNETTKGSVLLLDDDKLLLDMYGMKFTRSGYQAQTCLSVKDALEMLRAGAHPDAIVFDLTMPQEDGFAFLKALLAEHLGTGIALIALSNQGGDADKTKAESLGADRFIVKASMIPSEVVVAVEEEIAKKKKGGKTS